MSNYPHDEPCDHTADGDRCERMPTTHVGYIHYACKLHAESMREWVRGNDG